MTILFVAILALLLIVYEMNLHFSKRTEKVAKDAFLRQAQTIRNLRKENENLKNHLDNYMQYITEINGEVPELI